jgi:hypothetical protein
MHQLLVSKRPPADCRKFTALVLIAVYILLSGLGPRPTSAYAADADTDSDNFSDLNEIFSPVWSGHHPDAQKWTFFADTAIEKYGSSLMKGSKDINQFCPGYFNLEPRHRRYFWIQLIAAIAKFESGFSPTSRYVEASMGIDSVTHLPVVSEGLLQLSYQDAITYRALIPEGLCEFDYPQDRLLKPKDPRRSILDPRRNLTCGIAILNHQIARDARIGINRGAYWSVLKLNSRHSKLSSIAALTKSLNFCQ